MRRRRTRSGARASTTSTGTRTGPRSSSRPPWPPGTSTPRRSPTPSAPTTARRLATARAHGPGTFGGEAAPAGEAGRPLLLAPAGLMWWVVSPPKEAVMKRLTWFGVFGLALAAPGGLPGQEGKDPKKDKPDPAFERVKDDPNLPRVLLI